MLFICIEILQGHYMTALTLVEGTVKLLYDSSYDKLAPSSWPMDVFEPMLAKLQAMALGLVGTSNCLASEPPRFGAASHSGIPDKFSSIKEARDCLELYAQVHALSSPQEVAQLAGKDCYGRFSLYGAILARWSTAFDALVESIGQPLSSRDARAVWILKIRQIMMSISIDLALKAPLHTEVGIQLWDQYTAQYDDNQMRWDKYTTAFQEVVHIAQRIVERNDKDCPGTQQDQEPYLCTLDYGIVSPLYNVARLCRDPIIRRKAINLLRTSRVREGFWDGPLAARGAEVLMELEESAVCTVPVVASDIPAQARISYVKTIWEPGDQFTVVEFRRQHVDGLVDEQPILRKVVPMEMISRDTLDPF